MGGSKQPGPTQGNTMEQYTMTTPMVQRQTHKGVSRRDVATYLVVEEPSQADCMAMIQGSRIALEGKIETDPLEANLLRTELLKVSDKLRIVEGTIVELQF
ncbi:hypothetical protein NDU88_008008 [Pleurodeles waltl]|uniref:BON domain-containing protein n=1 Tax=Pleurodeles waltl TaxID=8319 RepID=A0AAV7NZJ6_PLEWA|nr:hypothetical protein NDU88_008008 [Pleurodeles waltl]